MKELFEKLTDSFDTVLPATPSALETAEKFFNLKLPSDYKAFLQFTNGLEGETTDNYLVLWSAEELVALNQAYNVKEFISNIIIFGSDGAEEAFGFYTTDMSIVKLPFIGMGHVPNEKLSDTFSAFLFSQTKD
ncbi:MAG: SMI1/KNR4 family protein [Agriterribacter sp.]